MTLFFGSQVGIAGCCLFLSVICFNVDASAMSVLAAGVAKGVAYLLEDVKARVIDQDKVVLTGCILVLVHAARLHGEITLSPCDHQLTGLAYLLMHKVYASPDPSCLGSITADNITSLLQPRSLFWTHE